MIWSWEYGSNPLKIKYSNAIKNRLTEKKKKEPEARRTVRKLLWKFHYKVNVVQNQTRKN